MRPRKVPSLEQVLILYDAFLRERDESKVAHALDLSLDGLRHRLERHPEYALAKHMADERRDTNQTFSEYIYQHLSPEAREVWKEIEFWKEGESSYDKINDILKGKAKKLKQELFIHVLVSSNFDLSEACRVIGVSRVTLDHWREDLEFRQLIEEIQWHKKNFMERALLDLVEERHPGAVIFVNRTMNADRGYSEKLELNHSGSIDTTNFSVEDLDLDLETRRKILDAIKRKKQAQQIHDLRSANPQALARTTDGLDN